MGERKRRVESYSKQASNIDGDGAALEAGEAYAFAVVLGPRKAALVKGAKAAAAVVALPKIVAPAWSYRVAGRYVRLADADGGGVTPW